MMPVNYAMFFGVKFSSRALLTADRFFMGAALGNPSIKGGVDCIARFCYSARWRPCDDTCVRSWFGCRAGYFELERHTWDMAGESSAFVLSLPRSINSCLPEQLPFEVRGRRWAWSQGIPKIMLGRSCCGSQISTLLFVASRVVSSNVSSKYRVFCAAFVRPYPERATVDVCVPNKTGFSYLASLPASRAFILLLSRIRHHVPLYPILASSPHLGTYSGSLLTEPRSRG